MKSKFPGPVPEIPVRDINQAAAYYQRNLGFTLDWGGEQIGLAGISKDIEFYNREYPKRIQRLRSTPGEQLSRSRSISSTSPRGRQSGFWGWPTTTASITAAN